MNKVIKANMVTVILGLATVISITVAIMSLISQAKLKSLTEVQSQQIAQLIKDKKEFQFSKTINEDNSITSIEELKKMVKDLGHSDNVLGTTAVEEIGTTILPPSMGMVTLSSGVTSVNIYDNPAYSANILSSTLPDTVMFYYQKQSGWHQVEYEVNKLGWIPDELIVEN